jgi:hypothetical protein
MAARTARGAVVLALAALAQVASCHAKPSTVLVVTVTLSGSLAPVAGLDVMVIAPAGNAENLYGMGGQPITFPTTMTAELPARITGDLRLDVKATDADGKTVAHGRVPFTVRVGTRQTILVRLDCGGDICVVAGGDGGTAPGGDAGIGSPDPTCGNGRIDVGETCDTALEPGAPGACPPANCDDGIPCTTDQHVGQACQARCVYQEVTTRIAGDNCCPSGATNADDADCSATCGNGTVDVGETCDTALADGTPGACPTATACNDQDPCTNDVVVAAGTCDSICAHVPVTQQSGAELDGCCPVGAWHAVDGDCPRACGDGQLDEPAELCDPGLPATSHGGCPTACDDGDPCTLDVLQGSGCQTRCVHTPITSLFSGDGCCPANANQRVDRDCPPSCGNGVVEVGESCDKNSPGADACPRSCPPSPSACLKSALAGDAAACTARCEVTRVTTCSPVADGCCAEGCTHATDPDCSPTCGDGVVQGANGETCDVAIAAGKPGACPTSCADGFACTSDLLIGAGTCQAACLHLLITAARAGDGCCPQGADASLDPDCPPLCGNAVVEPPGETCDYGAGMTACPTTCPGDDACTNIRLEGVAGTCNAACVPHPVTSCVAGDGCCPSWCTIARDADCPVVCGDGVLSPGEACDRGITTGLPGACPRTCDDADACTSDRPTGTVLGCSRACSHARVTACRGGDGCCPAGCAPASDPDCAPTCGDGQLGKGETCDPPSTCPATCPDDGDPCTRELLVGDARTCTAACQHVPVTSCSGKATDFCCPTGCTAASDVDCQALETGP